MGTTEARECADGHRGEKRGCRIRGVQKQEGTEWEGTVDVEIRGGRMRMREGEGRGTLGVGEAGEGKGRAGRE